MENDLAPAAGKFFILRSSFFIHEGKDKRFPTYRQKQGTGFMQKSVNKIGKLC